MVEAGGLQEQQAIANEAPIAPGSLCIYLLARVTLILCHFTFLSFNGLFLGCVAFWVSLGRILFNRLGAAILLFLAVLTHLPHIDRVGIYGSLAT